MVLAAVAARLVGVAALAGCATAPAPRPIAAAQAQAEPLGPARPAGESPGRFPARAEVLAFQEYGRTVADRVSLDPQFGGFIFKSEPEPHAIVMFTGNAEARLRRYTRDSRFMAKRVDITLAKLERQKSATGDQLMSLRLKCWTVDADEEHNTVTVSTPEVEQVRAAIADGRFKPPPKFRLVVGSCVTWR